MPVDRRVMAGGAAFVGFVVAVHAVAKFVAAPTATLLVDLALPLLEGAALALAVVAFLKNSTSRYRWTWLLLGLWLAANLFADGVSSWYELVRGTDPPPLSIVDVGYLVSFPLAFLTVVFAAWKAAGRLRAIGGALDATLFTVGVAGLAWPLLLAPLLQTSSSGLQHVVNFAYPLGDLLVIMAFASLLLGSFQERPPRFLIVILAAFLVEVVADAVYFAGVAQEAVYLSEGFLDILFALVFAVAGIAALMGVFPGAERNASTETQAARPKAAPVARDLGLRARIPSYSRLVLPYLAIPLVGAMMWMQLSWYGPRWNSESRPLIYLGVVLMMLMVVRQFVTLVENRLLNLGLSGLSSELGERVDVLADLTGRLEELNTGANHLNSLRSPGEVMRAGLELACSVTGSPAAWITMPSADGTESVAAIVEFDEEIPVMGSGLTPFTAPDHRVQEVRLEARGERLGTLCLLRPLAGKEGPDLVPALGAHLATAIDNTRRYEEALRLAEKDPLTGLLNHRGIYERLALEEGRASQLGNCLSLMMIDLDDFKVLNDTYGHPAGDRVLAQVSEAIRGVLRHSDAAGRVGGDEMMLVLPDTDRDGALRLAERMREHLGRRPFLADGELAIPLKLSIGVATYPSDGDSLPSLVAAADASLYASKQRGGDTVSDPRPKEETRVEERGLRSVAGRLTYMVGSRNHYTRRHSDRVVVHALNLGESLGLSRESLETLRLAAMFHDAGKTGVRSRLLRRPVPLTAEEERAVRQQAGIGEAIVRDLPRLAEVLEVVHAHNERHDGKGYPVGLSGRDIPLLARILAVADAYAALMAERPYHKKLTGEQAKAELLKAAGKQLDPELVCRFLENLKEEPAATGAATG